MILTTAAVTSGVLEPHPRGDPREAGHRLLPTLRPLDEGDRVRAEVVRQQVGIFAGQTRDAKQVQVGDGDGRGVALADRERRAGDRAARRPATRQAPRTNVVLPAPRSPSTSTTSPATSSAASPAPSASVCVALLDSYRPRIRDTL